MSVAAEPKPAKADKAIARELKAIEKRDGTLRPEAVVAYARNPKTALHSRFEWDDSAAAEAYRLEQARRVIRLRIEIVGESKEPVRYWASLQSDRRDGNGYRAIVTIMSDDDRRRELLAMALAEARMFQKKYRQLRELADVFAAIDAAAADHEASEPALVGA